MSRSRKKTPISGITKARSEKQDKRIANRRYRSRVKHQLRNLEDAEGVSLSIVREVTNVWSMAKDGKRWYDPEKYPWVLRK